MLATYVRKLFIGTVATTVIAVVSCSSPAKKPAGTGAAGTTGTAGTTATAGTTGTAGSTDSTAGTTGTAGTAGTTDTGGTTGTAGTTATGGTTGTAGTTATGGTTGTAGAGGTTAAGGDTGAAGTTTPPADNVPIQALPVAVTSYWFASGWGGDANTASMFAPGIPFVITDQTGAATGPCSMRVAGAIGNCFKITYTPIIGDAGAPMGSIYLINDLANAVHNYADQTMAPRAAQGAKRIAGQVAGAVGGEAVLFNLGSPMDPVFKQFTGLTLTTAWQKIDVSLDGVTYDHFLSPFGWSSTSTTPVTFYYDDLRIDATAATTP